MVDIKTNYISWRELRHEYNYLISDFSSTKRHKFSLMFIVKAQNLYFAFKVNMGLLNPITQQNSIRSLLGTNNSFGDAIYNTMNELNLLKYITILKSSDEIIMTNLKVSQIQLQQYQNLEEIMAQFDIDNWEHKEIENSPHFTLNKIDNKQVIFSKLIIDLSDNNHNVLNNVIKLLNLKSIHVSNQNEALI